MKATARKKITTLSEAQQARFAEYVQRWVAIGLSTEPANRREAERAIQLCYQIGGLAAPARYIWSGSPMAQAITRAVMVHKEEIEQTNTASRAQASEPHVADLQGAIRAGAAQAAEGLPENLRNQIIQNAQNSVSESMYGQHDANWLAFYAYMREVLGLVKETEKITGLMAFAQHAGWAIPHQNVCFIAERHNVIRRDSQNRLHAEFGPALTYPDGWGFHMLHGIRVEPWMAEIHPDELDARKVLQIENVDQRREVIRRIGSERLVLKLEGKVVDRETRRVGGKYELLEVDMRHGAPWKFLKMSNQSVEATHIEAVPRECMTVSHAINWRANQKLDENWFPSVLT